MNNRCDSMPEAARQREAIAIKQYDFDAYDTEMNEPCTSGAIVTDAQLEPVL